MTQPHTAPPGIASATLPGWKPELVALDLDGTCLTAAVEPHPRTASTIGAAAKRLPVVIASGRMYRSALPWARRLGVTAPLICYQGALVRGQPATNSDTPGTVIAEFTLDRATATQAISIARQHGWHRQAYRNDRLLCEEDRPEAHFYDRIAAVGIDYVDDLEAAVGDGSTKVVCVVSDEATALRCEAAMREALDGAARVVRSMSPFVEITNPQATKGRALQRLCRHLGADIAKTIAIGDAPNDADMLEAAGFGVAIEGSRDAVLRVAQATCAPPEQAGVASVLEAFGLV